MVGQCHEGCVLRIGVQTAADDVNTLQRVDGLAVLTSLQVYMIEAVLGIEPIGHTFLDGLYDNDASVEVGLLVHVPDDPVNERTEEITFTELNYFLGHHALRRELFV